MDGYEVQGQDWNAPDPRKATTRYLYNIHMPNYTATIPGWWNSQKNEARRVPARCGEQGGEFDLSVMPGRGKALTRV